MKLIHTIYRGWPLYIAIYAIKQLEKKIFLMISMASKLEEIGSSNRLAEPFKRTLSRLFELTSPKDNLSAKVV